MKKNTLLLLFVTLFYWGQNQNDIRTALIIVDIQQFYFPNGDLPLVNPEIASLKAKEVLETFRKNKLPVIHIQHKAKNGFDIHPNVKPISDEKIIVKTEANSFAKTELLNYLKEQKINKLVIIGMQTQMCVEATIRAAYDFGFNCIVIEDACATRDLKYGEVTISAQEVHASTLATVKDGGYGRVLTAEEFIKETQKILYSK